jgi:hypothetical protein
VDAASEAFDMTRRIRHAQDSADYAARARNATVAVEVQVGFQEGSSRFRWPSGLVLALK